jgi:membrane peptidoglycan carboxypeptidase
MSKIAILRSYLAIVYLGSGISGIGDAARKVFHKELNELSLQEMSMIAAMMVYPRPRVPTDIWKKRVEKRAQYGVALYRKYQAQYMRKLPDIVGL